MTKSGNTSAFRVIRIDGSILAEHYYLAPDDECYCLGEYQPGGGYGAGPVNNLISNFKKSVDRKGRSEYVYKERAIAQVASYVGQVLKPEVLERFTVVPVPPSKAKTDPLYDDRLVQALNLVRPKLDVRELLLANRSMQAHHEYQSGVKRPTPDDLCQHIHINEACLTTPLREVIMLFDDVLTNGTHFKACQRIIRERFPDRRVFGLFIGRSKRPDPLEDFD
ncbi:hypothetical protein [Alicycliphilus denitrificans]|uniref:hypothetical protein n=1 Tax=Alicycliphilus denitrificans TaxID=179636 RepID=UPI0001DA01F9|nr:hypothetical protein [Alicycliphilus denitrificans]ADU99444.1 hypothetical protein Alide_1689 [Alicycliphilus denitrificans BC]